MELTVRILSDKDTFLVEELDNVSDFEISHMLDGDEYCWGIFNDNKLIGYLTIGCADCAGEEIEQYQGWTDHSLLLSDVFVIPKFRRQGVARKLINGAIEKHSETKDNLIFITFIDCSLRDFYKKFDFKDISEDRDVWIMVKQC